MINLLQNAGFEGEWWRETAVRKSYGEIFVPKPWVAYWREATSVPHDPANQVGYGRPEFQVISRETPFLVPLRIRTGSRAVKLFTFYRIHDAGLLQQVQGIQPGSRLRGTAWAHAWSSSVDDSASSDGAGNQPIFVRESDPLPESLLSAESGLLNFTFSVGIDPKGGTDPWSADVVWGEGAHIYNGYAQIPPVEVVAATSTITFFIRSSVLWPLKHCDAYLDDAQLVVVGETSTPLEVEISPASIVAGVPFEVRAQGDDGAKTFHFGHEGIFAKPPVVRDDGSLVCQAVATAPGVYEVRVISVTGASGSMNFAVEPTPVLPSPDFIPPREPYVRTYLLLPPDASGEWLMAVASSGIWDRRRWTIGGSADDAGIGPKVRRVVAINPHQWRGDLRKYLEEAYPGVDYVALTAASPADLMRLLRSF